MYILNPCSECGVRPDHQTYSTIEENERFGRLSSVTITNHQFVCPSCSKSSYCLRDYLAAAIHWNKKNPKKKVAKAVPQNLSAEREKTVGLLVEMATNNATTEEIGRVARFSLSVIDAEEAYQKYAQSYFDNQIAELKLKY